ncbi:redoxin domain-containing protein [Hymenobacter sp. B81]|uniref:redoxin domain-containing protein n=1 Tax=Hymenobacter sp. B81 TaxID=3344878 RepID=UPI0037DDB168
MKNLIGAFGLGGLLLLSAGCRQAAVPTSTPAAGFTLKGRLEAAPTGTVVSLLTTGNEPRVLDSARLDRQGRFRLAGQVPEADVYALSFRPGAPLADSARSVMLVLSNGSAQQVAGDLRRPAATYTVRGSAETAHLQKMQALIRRQDQRVGLLERRLLAAASHPDTLRLIQRRYYQSRSVFRRDVRQFVQSNSGALAAAYATAYLLDFSLDRAFIDSMRTRFEQLRPDSRYTKYLGAKLRLDTSAPIRELGTQDFVLPGIDGRPVALSSLRGQPVLVYFWWPSQRSFRQEARQVHQLCAEYAAQGLRLYSVCLEPERANWRQVVAEDSLAGVLTWDPNGQASYARFPLRSIPASVLLDAQGRVIGQDLRGESLVERLVTLFD